MCAVLLLGSHKWIAAELNQATCDKLSFYVHKALMGSFKQHNREHVHQSTILWVHLYINIKGKCFHMCVYVYVSVHMHSGEQTLQITQNALFEKFQSLWIILRRNWFRSLKRFASLMITTRLTYLTAACKNDKCAFFE